MRRTRRGIIACALVVAVGACDTGVDAPPPAAAAVAVDLDVVERRGQCPADAPRVDVFADAAAWAEWRARGATPLLGAGGGQAPAPAVDFDASRVVVVSMGQRPTAGYGLDVAGDARLRGATLEIDTVWQTPGPDAIVAQVLTSPCVAVVVSSTAFERVRILNRDGNAVIDHAL